MKNNFDKWLDNLIKKQKINILDTYIITKDGKSREVTLEQILDCLKLLNDEEKIQTQKTIENVIQEEGSITDCLIYLGVGCMKILEEIELDDEEAM